MNDTTKTATIVGIGTVLLSAGLYFLPSKADFTTESKIGKALFPELKDGNVAQGMEIVSYDEKLGTSKKFAVKILNNRWVLSSHDNYPADKTQQLVDAASSLVNLTALSETTVNPEKYEIYGVLDPTDEKVQAGSTGVGKLVIFKDGSSKTLAKLIIGKQPTEQGSTKEKSDKRYVRIAGQAPIYTVKLAADNFSPKFEDWIETSLFKLKELDIREVLLRDFSFRPKEKPKVLREILLNFNSQEKDWSLEKMVEFSGDTKTEVALTDQEKLNSAKLNKYYSALNDLKIVNVLGKPQALLNTLRGEGTGMDKETEFLLAQQGFYLDTMANGGPQMISLGGEVSVSLQNGLQYTLRFGDYDKSIPDNAESEAENKDPKNTAPKPAQLSNRYLMVEASFNPDLIPKPVLEEVPPEAPAAGEKKQEPKKEVPKSPETPPESEGKPKSAKPTEGNQPAPKDASKSQPPSKTGEQSSLLESPFRTAAFQPPAKDTPKTDNSPAESKTTDPKNADTEATQSIGADPRPVEVKPEDANDPADANFKRNQIIRRNEAQLEAYKTKLQAGQFHAQQLNERFAEWYFVIPDEVYERIHLGKNDIIIPLQPPTNSTKIPAVQGPTPGLIPGGK